MNAFIKWLPLFLLGGQLFAQAPQHVGKLPDGGFLLNSGWTLRPAGEQVPVDTLPMSTALSADGKYLLVLNAGYHPPSVSVIDVANKREVSRYKLTDAWLGLAMAPHGDRVYVGGGTSGVVYELLLDPATGKLTSQRELPAVADLNNKGESFIGDVTVRSDGHVLYAADLETNNVAVVDLDTGKLIGRFACGRRPYRLLLSPDSKRLMVSSWSDGSIYQYDANNGKETGRIRVAPELTDMLWVNGAPDTEGAEKSSYVARLFVVAENTNNVYSLGVTADGQLSRLESINLSLTPMHPLGMTPSALAADKEGTHLYVVCSDANAVAAVNISGSQSIVAGFVPTGWYPTAVRELADHQVVILNGKGLGSAPNPNGPNPTRRAAPLHEGNSAVQYIPSMQTGTVSFVPALTGANLHEYTTTVMRNSPYRDQLIYGPPADQKTAYFSRSENHPSPIQHVIYVIKENRTYDQVLSDLNKGNGDKSLSLFGEQVTPNLHRLASEFILYDNFYENADVSAEGHNWANAAIAPDYTVKLWPNSYAHRRHTYDYEGGEAANLPPAGYLWSNALQAGVSIRDYGEWTTNIPLDHVNGSRQIASVKDRSLAPCVDMNYRGFDLGYPDVKRAEEFIREWKGYDATGQAPQLLIVRMGNDHTMGTAAGKLTPFAYNADNDYAVGMLVDAVSHSKLWASTAIFITEDDAQNGPDHVDSHRAPAWVISPYTHRGTVDSNMYNQTSVLRTMELIVGLKPMTQFDAASRPMFDGFSQQPDLRPYSVISPKVSLTETNPDHAPGAAESARMDFSDADKSDDDDLNAILWKSIKGTDLPAPTRSLFAR
ncbi:MAG TPA: bifunctional YncE family protein/alkaline phosphatase family protein [Bryobacteraceae bacterium]